MSDEACSRFLEHTVVDNCVAEDTSEIWLVHVALLRKVFEKDSLAVEGDLARDVITVDGFEAGGFDLQ